MSAKRTAQAGDGAAVAAAGGLFDFPNQQVVRADGSGPGIEIVAPTVTSLNPASAVAGSPALTVHAIGTGFTPTSVMNVDGVDRPTTYVSATDVSASITPRATAGSMVVHVRNGNEASTPARGFTVTATGGE